MCNVKTRGRLVMSHNPSKGSDFDPIAMAEVMKNRSSSEKKINRLSLPSNPDDKTTKEYDYLIFIGRVQPFHVGHHKILTEALKRAKCAVMLIGSSNTSRSIRNPFTFEERADMIRACFPQETQDDRLIIAPINDHPYNDQKWIAHVQQVVQGIILDRNNTGLKVHLEGMQHSRVGLIGFSKDSTSYYLKKFPQWSSVDVKQTVVYNATDIRNNYFRSAPSLPRDIAPAPVVDFMKSFMETQEFIDLVAEQKFITKYHESWSGSPYSPHFVTADAVVIQSGHVLLIRRGHSPGRGLLALPGGFVNQNEKVMDAAVRELKEETQITDHRGDIPPAKLRSLITAHQFFDLPERDPRGRVFSHTYLFKLPEAHELYGVKGGDDAAEAGWYPIGTLNPRDMFLDHYHILSEMLEDV